MKPLITHASAASKVSGLGRMIRKALGRDNATQRFLDETYVQVHLNSRIWMV